jgi:hypothetical protein
MTCADFQSALPYIIDNGGNAEQQEHLGQCAVCSDLVADLKYIAEQAKLLVPMIEPPRKVWDGIKTSLEREGLVKDSARGGLLGSLPLIRWGPGSWLIPVAALLCLAVGLFYFQNRAGQTSAGAAQTASQSAQPAAPLQLAAMGDAQDQQVLSEVAAHAPALSQAYRQELRRVNAYISDARGQVATNPDDEDSRQALLDAYQQKAMLYNMAMQHSLP